MQDLSARVTSTSNATVQQMLANLTTIATFINASNLSNTVAFIQDQRSAVAALSATVDRLPGLLRVPVGTITPFAGFCNPSATATGQGSPPSGWMCCGGTAVSRSDSKTVALFGVIGVQWGSGDGVSTLNLPDLRGRFIRGVDGASGRDPDVASRWSQCVNCKPADVGSLQGSATKLPLNGFSTADAGTHSHNGVTSTEVNFPGTGLIYKATDGVWDSLQVATGVTIIATRDQAAARHSHYIAADGNHRHTIGDAETRPPNAFVHYIIKL